MIGLQTENKLAQLLKTIADGEKEIEVVRQVLAEQLDFEPYTAFKRIDRDANSSISIYEVIDFLRDNQIYATERDVNSLFKIYDLNNDGRLNYSEFLGLVLPQTSPALRQLATQRQSYYVSRYETLPYETEWALARVFDKEINYARKLELLKEDLALRYDWDNLQAFKLIDEDRTGLIDLDSIYIFLKRNHIIVSESDILALLRRADTDNDGKLTYSEFVDAISPAGPIRASKTISRDTMRYSTPNRTSSSRSRMAQSTVFSSAQKKLSNLDYYEYLSNSEKKARYSTSPIRSTNKRLTERSPSPKKDLYSTPTRSRSPLKEKSPLKEIEETQLAVALKEEIDLDKEIEDLKNQLALKSDFNLLDAFRFFDLDARGYITKMEFKDGVNYFGLYPTNDETYLTFRAFDTDNDGILRYAEFSEIFTPKAHEYASLLDRVPSYLDGSKLSLIFSYETRYLIKKVLDATINNERRCEELRQKLDRRPLFNIYEAFKNLDKNDNGYIDINEFRDALIENGLYASTKEISNIVKRFDHNQDGKVSYYDFVQEMTPKSPQKY